MFAYMKVALLLIEYSLPIGAINNSDGGTWKPEIASYWRYLVQNSQSPAQLMGCLIVFEDALSMDWLRPNAEHLLLCLPKHWKAMNEATVSSLALRIWLLDGGIKYGLVVKSDYATSTSKARKSKS